MPRKVSSLNLSARSARDIANQFLRYSRKLNAGRITALLTTLIVVLSIFILFQDLFLKNEPDSDADLLSTNQVATGVVDEVIDGDTLKIKLGRRSESVRLLGINTPETVAPNKPIECFGKEASAHMKDLAPAGTKVKVQRDIQARDRYDRLLLYVYRSNDNLFLNEEMIKSGFAQPMNIAPNNAYADRFSELASQARFEGKGLWSACNKK